MSNVKLHTIESRVLEIPVDSSVTCIRDLTRMLVSDYGYEAGVRIVHNGKVMQMHEKIIDIQSSKHKAVVTGQVREDVYQPAAGEEELLAGVLMEVSEGETHLEKLLRAFPEFENIRQSILRRTASMETAMRAIQRTHPDILAAIDDDQTGFLDILKYGLPQVDDSTPDMTDLDHGPHLEEAALCAVLQDILGGQTELEVFMAGIMPSIQHLVNNFRDGDLTLEELAATVVTLHGEVHPLIEQCGEDVFMACLQNGPPQECSQRDIEAEVDLGGGEGQELLQPSAAYTPQLPPQEDVATLISATGVSHNEAVQALLACEGDIEAAAALLLD
eukprot:TRINITY_DN2233_c0_g1_i1.p1 TRINITY_DN2233_c0_g1~~TRINITY_DN2233_c0_g1_i1.p1  ORF type:complete len:331 (+),score=80.19 TRINITY_DN2233_c0_g1_i1:100-1092(+)